MKYAKHSPRTLMVQGAEQNLALGKPRPQALLHALSDVQPGRHADDAHLERVRLRNVEQVVPGPQQRVAGKLFKNSQTHNITKTT